MEFVILELFLWAGLLFLFWTLRDGLQQIESELQQSSLLKQENFMNRPVFARPDRLIEPIGTYREAPIYRYAEIQGKRYQFDFAYPVEQGLILQPWQRYLAPGLVYEECREPVVAASQAINGGEDNR